jgi:hypothetical protein
MHWDGLGRSLYHQRVFDWLDQNLGGGNRTGYLTTGYFYQPLGGGW